MSENARWDSGSWWFRALLVKGGSCEREIPQEDFEVG